ncbi:CHASE domain-containing protein [Actomonas aquatica]|uniref:CHASE domain-containing protein n=1 Tax=Actomonas aquatica TaxID=2866162 RepID=A0ABZ1CC52_9BACT|nr:CHASE domain-containing protein [Opitutus sp. WL0086]WRQ89263.1 CHASE domain-containing protein [Opitutus sp. WL0086]
MKQLEIFRGGERGRGLLRYGPLPPAVGALALGAVSILFALLLHGAQRADEARFEALTDQVSAGFNTRLASTAQALRAASVAAASQETMSRQTWVNFLDRVALGTDDGLVGLGYVARVNRADVAAHEAWVRARGEPDYKAALNGSHPQLYLVSFIEPREINGGALGIDIADGTSRREAAEIAMRENRVSMSRRIKVLVGEGTTPGFLLFYPVYHRDAAVATMVQREEALQGWVYAAVRVDTLVNPLQERVKEEINFSILEGETLAGGRLLWRGNGEGEAGPPPRFSRITRVSVFGQPWVLVTESKPVLRDLTAQSLAWVSLAGGWCSASWPSG